MNHILWTENDRICIILVHTLDPRYGQFLTTDFLFPRFCLLFASPSNPRPSEHALNPALGAFLSRLALVYPAIPLVLLGCILLDLLGPC